MATIIWLASYPKSGNTWLRLLLANYFLRSDAPFPINRLSDLGYSDTDKSHYAHVSGRAYETLSKSEALRLRRPVFEFLGANGADLNLIKTHNMNGVFAGVRMIPPQVTRGAIYMARDPRDTAASMAPFFGMDPGRAVAVMNSPESGVAHGPGSVFERYSDWSAHVSSWLDEPAFPVHLLRYEDLAANTETVFSGVLAFLGAPVEPDQVAQAVAWSGFDQARSQEEAEGFRENPGRNAAFFREGRVGGWKNALPQNAADRLVRRHGDVMRRLGYL